MQNIWISWQTETDSFHISCPQQKGNSHKLNKLSISILAGLMHLAVFSHLRWLIFRVREDTSLSIQTHLFWSIWHLSLNTQLYKVSPVLKFLYKHFSAVNPRGSTSPSLPYCAHLFTDFFFPILLQPQRKCSDQIVKSQTGKESAINEDRRWRDFSLTGCCMM